MKKKRPARLFLLFCMLLFSSPILLGGNINKNAENQLKKLYEKKTFILRHFYSGEKLKYSPEGILVSGGKPGIWTLDGLITINKLKIKNEKLEMTGKREFWSYDQKEKKPRQFKSTEKTTIEIGPFNAPSDATLLHQAIQNIFLKDNEPLHNAVPDYWKNTVIRFFTGQNALINNTPKKQLFNRGDNLTLPKLISKADPQYTPTGRKLRVGGTVMLKVKIDKEGNVSLQEIVLPLGLDLDESAIKAVLKWKYAPASLNGEPIDFETTLTMQFYIGS
ncbi:MAG: energy transducer TonB [Acidobacteria bacterium]|nr:energy transducer TonB [Acidobacteriota bacterium]